MRRALASFFIMAQFLWAGAARADGPIVLELYTSQGCSSCPPADALLTELAKDPTLLPLSIHVNYWDHLGWTDPYASRETTARQYAYASALRTDNVFTPQMMVQGINSAIGSSRGAVKEAIEDARKYVASRAKLSVKPSGGRLGIDVENAGNADILAFYFKRRVMTHVGAGENEGRALESANVVTKIVKLGTGQGHYSAELPGEGVAIVAQMPGPGRITGAASYLKP